MKQGFSKKKLIIEILIVVVIAAITGAAAYVRDCYHSQDVTSAMSTTKDIRVESISDGYFFDGPGEEKAMIFYPGGKVEYTAYAPLLKAMAVEGIDCFLVEMPGNLAVFGANKASDIMSDYTYDNWYLSGHSLGGAMAASYANKHISDLDGLLLLGAYATSDLTDADFPVILMYGERDQVMNRENYESNRENLPPGYTEVVIPGGNHAGFGNYGEQKGDGKATISPQEQQQQVIDTIKNIF